MALGFPILGENVKITKVNAYAASAGTDIETASVDMAGFDGVTFVGEMITANASNFITVETSTDDSSFADLLGSKITPGTSGDSFAVTIHKPLERYLRVEVDRGGTNTAMGSIFAFQYGARKVPVSHASTVDHETHISPARGTA